MSAGRVIDGGWDKRPPRRDDGVDTTCGDGNDRDMNVRLSRVETRLEHIESELSFMRTELKELRWWIAAAFLAVIGIVVGFGQFQASWLQGHVNLVSEENRRVLDTSRTEWEMRFERSQGEADKRYDQMQADADKRADRLKEDIKDAVRELRAAIK